MRPIYGVEASFSVKTGGLRAVFGEKPVRETDFLWNLPITSSFGLIRAIVLAIQRHSDGRRKPEEVFNNTLDTDFRRYDERNLREGIARLRVGTKMTHRSEEDEMRYAPGTEFLCAVGPITPGQSHARSGGNPSLTRETWFL